MQQRATDVQQTPNRSTGLSHRLTRCSIRSYVRTSAIVNLRNGPAASGSADCAAPWFPCAALLVVVAVRPSERKSFRGCKRMCTPPIASVKPRICSLFSVLNCQHNSTNKHKTLREFFAFLMDAFGPRPRASLPSRVSA